MMDDYKEKYPLFSNFMTGIWNQTASDHYPDLQTAVQFHLVSYPFHMLEGFLREIKGLRAEEKFIDLMNHKKDRHKLAYIWGGRTIRSDELAAIEKITANYIEHREFKVVSSSD